MDNRRWVHYRLPVSLAVMHDENPPMEECVIECANAAAAHHTAKFLRIDYRFPVRAESLGNWYIRIESHP